MATPLSTLTALSNDSTLAANTIIDPSEMNTHRTTYRSLINSLLLVASDVENNYAGAAAPTDKPAGKLWWDTGNTALKIYTALAGSLKQIWVDGATFPAAVTQTFTTSPLALVVGGTTWRLAGAASKTIQASGVDQASYVDTTGTAGADATAQIVKQITLKANSLNAVGKGIRINVLYLPSSATAITTTLYLGTAGTTGDLNIRQVATSATSATWITATILYVNATTIHAVSKADTVNLGLGTVNGTTNITNTSDMFISVGQSNAAATHITVYAIFVEQLG